MTNIRVSLPQTDSFLLGQTLSTFNITDATDTTRSQCWGFDKRRTH